MEINQDRLIKALKTTDEKIIDIDIKNVKKIKSQIEAGLTRPSVFKVINTYFDIDDVAPMALVLLFLFLMVSIVVFVELGFIVLLIGCGIVILIGCLAVLLVNGEDIKDEYECEKIKQTELSSLNRFLEFLISVNDQLLITFSVSDRNIMISGYNQMGVMEEVILPRKFYISAKCKVNLTEDISHCEKIYVKSCNNSGYNKLIITNIEW